ncbi:cadherin-like beta sandwich domain-containing protein [Brucepastera parasyntrophica]|nr:cadherin-like beta sandwich domain-containing protein [Brucepastera parasyntrophica]
MTAPDGTGLSKTGMGFAGWNTKADGTGVSYAAGSKIKITGNLKLYAQWAGNSYTVTYDGNGHTGGAVPASADSVYGESHSLAGPGGLEKTGHSFAGWNTEPDGSGTPYPAGTGVTADWDGPVTLYARWVSGNADLSNLTVSEGALSPAFDPGVISYTVEVPDTTDSLTVTGAAADSGAELSANSGAPQTLSGDSTPVTIRVTAADGSIKDYTVTIVRLDTAKTITGFSFTGLAEGNINENEKTVTLTAPYGTAVTGLVPDITHTGVSVSPASGEAEDFTNPVTYTVTAADSSAQIYTVTVSVASLVSITLSGAYKTQYKIGESLDTSGLVITGTDSAGNSVAIPASSCDFTGFNSATTGEKTVTVTVTGTSVTKTFSVTVLSNNANLSALTVSNGTLTPVFDTNTTSYTVSVANSVTSITVTGTKADSTAGLSSNNGEVQTLSLGTNPISITVTAQDGTTKVYTVTVTRSVPSTNANLSGISLTSGTLSPVFTSDVLNYTVRLANSVSGVRITGIAADSGAVVSGSGSTDTLTVGTATPKTITVTAEDGVTTKTYTVTVTRQGSASLSALTASAGQLTLASSETNFATTGFASAALDYIVGIAGTSGETKSVTINATSASGTVSYSLAGGVVSGISRGNPQALEITVTNGSETCIYTVTCMLVGYTGEAGLVFYDKGNSTGGWQYLEAATADAGTAEWGLSGVRISETVTSIGSGKGNTGILVSALTAAGESGRAALLCDAYSGAGRTDWYMPSKDELNLMYSNLHKNSLGSFTNHGYWSSSQYSPNEYGVAWSQYFNSGDQMDNRNISFYVRACRAF